MATKWVMDKNYEWEQIEKPKRRPKEVKKPIIKNKGKDAQFNIKGFCPCGRESGGKNAYRRNPKYCSRYCFEFMTFPADGYKKKTRYEFWRGTGKYAYNPPWPKLEASCAWCNDKFNLTRNVRDANRLFCSRDCMKQSRRNPKSTSKRNGSTQIALRIRTMIILRAFPNQELTTYDIASHYRDWFRLSCSPTKIACSIRTIVKAGWVRKTEVASQRTTYSIVDENTPLKTLFGETEGKLGR